jgi:molybdenum cofactor cytidylyltransferase
MILPWGETTVIGQVVKTLNQAGVDEILVVTGETHPQVALALQDQPVQLVRNPSSSEEDMLDSLQLGLSSLDKRVQAALVVLGDQPQIEENVVVRILTEYLLSHPPLVVPSYQMRRGHPWLIDRQLFSAVLEMYPPETLRDFLRAHKDLIRYIVVETSSILQDLDTPEDYQHYRPSRGSSADSSRQVPS